MSNDIDQSLYDNFVSNKDRKICNHIQSLSSNEIGLFNPNFEDRRLLKLASTVRGRVNFGNGFSFILFGRWTISTMLDFLVFTLERIDWPDLAKMWYFINLFSGFNWFKSLLLKFLIV